MEDRGAELLSPPLNEVVGDNPAHRKDLTQAVPEKDLERLANNPQTKRFDKQAFVYDAETDCFYCPAGRPLPRAGKENVVRSGETVELTVYICPDCGGCAYATRCRTNVVAKRGRKVTRDGYEEIRKRHSARMRQEDVRQRYSRRLHFGETPFAVLTAALDLRRFLLRGHLGVPQEWLWGCSAYNLKKLIRLWVGLRAEGSATTTSSEI